MSDRSSPGESPSLIDVLKQLGRDWRDLAERARQDVVRFEEPDKEQLRALARDHDNHAIYDLFRLIEESTGIDRETIRTAAWRINSTIGLRPLLRPRRQPTRPADSEDDDLPGGDEEGKPDLPDLRWLYPRLTECDVNGTTARILRAFERLHPTALAATPCGVKPLVSLAKLIDEAEAKMSDLPSVPDEGAPTCLPTDAEFLTVPESVEGGKKSEPLGSKGENSGKDDSAVWASHCGGALICSPDYCTVKRGAETFSFTPTQRACVKYLVEAMEKGRQEFTNKELLDAAGSTADYIRDVFRSNGKAVPAWNKLIVEVEGKRGSYTLRLTSTT